MDYDALEKRLREPPFGTETSERNLMMAAADAIAEKDAEITRLREVIEAWHDIDRKRDAEIERLKAANGILEDALQEVGDDYPGSSCQEWCRQQVKQARAALKEPSHDEG